MEANLEEREDFLLKLGAIVWLVFSVRQNGFLKFHRFFVEAPPLKALALGLSLVSLPIHRRLDCEANFQSLCEAHETRLFVY